MPRVYVGIGSNLGDRRGRLLRSIDEMRSFSNVKGISAFRKTEPVGVVGKQPHFLNAVVELETDLSPRELIQELLRVEADMGRIRKGRGRAREIDLDLLAYADEVINEPDLQIPHPRMHERRFVLEPLAELAPGWVHPVLGKSAAELLVFTKDK